MKRGGAIIYSRVSTQRQVYSLNVQEHFLTKFAIYNGFPIVDKYREVGSGTDISKLTQLQTIINKIEPEQFVLIRDVSRIGRNYYQVFDLINNFQKNANIVYAVNDGIASDSSSFVIAVQSADYSLETQKTNQKIAFDYIKQNGGHIGKVPYGFEINKTNGIPKLVKNEMEHNVIEIIKEWYSIGMSLNSIAIQLNDSMVTKRGIIWTPQMVKMIIKKS